MQTNNDILLNMSKTQKLTTALMALALVSAGLIGAVGSASAASAQFDSETATTSSTSDVSGSSTTLTWYPSNDTKTIRVQTDHVSVAKKNLKVVVEHPSADVNETYYTNKTDSAWTTINSTDNQYRLTIPHAELSDAPRTEDKAKVDIRLINESDGSEVINTTAVLDQSHLSSTTARIPVLGISGSSAAYNTPYAADDLDVKTDSGFFSGLSVMGVGGSNDTVTTFSDEIGVNGTNTKVVVPIKDSETQSAFDAAASNTKSGEWMTDAMLTVNNEPLKVYDTKASSPTDEKAYGVYDSESNTLELVYNNDSDFKNADAVTVSATAGDSYEFGTLKDSFGISSAWSVLSAEIPMPA